MITVYHLLNSRSERVIWLLEELGEPYELQVFAREPTGAAPAAYKALHPVGASPIVRDGGVTLVETGAILEHILHRYGRGRLAPAPMSDDYARFLQWMHFAEGSVAAAIFSEQLALAYADPEGPRTPLHQMWRGRSIRNMRYVEAELGERPYLAGEAFTAADIIMLSTFSQYERFTGRSLAESPNIQAYLARVQARPAYVRAMAVAHPAGEAPIVVPS